MRPFEIAIIVLNALALLSRLYKPAGRGLTLIFSGLAFVALLAHGLFEGPRWQMIPLYVLTVALAVLAVRPLFVRLGPARPRFGWILLGLILLALASLPPILMPVPTFRKPDGPHPVGTTSFFWEDPSRVEHYSPQPGGPRKLMVQVWYPANPRPGDLRAPWLEHLDLAGKALAEQNDLPPQLAGYLALARTNSYLDAPLVAGSQRFPVLVFSHGWDGVRTQNTYQMEMLASHGYIVFAPDHTYGAAISVFPTGEVAMNNPDALPSSDLPDPEYDRVAQQLGQTWSGDLRFVLDQVERLDSGAIPSPFSGRLDLSQEGMLGHSTGGGAAIAACWEDSRCKAVLGMDAWLVPYPRQMVQEGLDVPLLLMHSQYWHARNNQPLVDALAQNTRAGLYRETIAGTVHYDFSDVPAFSPLAKLVGMAGSVPPGKLEALVNEWTLTFFDQALKGVKTGPGWMRLQAIQQ